MHQDITHAMHGSTAAMSVAESPKNLNSEHKKHKKGQTTLKQIVNEALRHGLERMGQPVVPQKPFRTHAVNLGQCYFPNLDNTGEVLAGAEGESRN